MICRRFSSLHPYLCGKFEGSMTFRRLKSLLVAVFSLSILFFSNTSLANEGPEEKFDPAALIMDHIKDGHEFHIGLLT